MEPGGPVLVQLPAGLVEDAYDVTLWGSTATPSAPQTLVIVDPARPSLDAPDILRHSRGSDLVLTGRALGVGAANVVFWPDDGVSAPTDVVTVAGNAAGAVVTLPAANLAALWSRLYRLSVQYSPHGFTPHVLLEITA